MLRRRVATTAAMALCIASLSPLAAHAASSGASTYYVDNTTQNNNSTCNDTGPGTEVEPFCSITAAVGVATVPGDTVLIEPGAYDGEVHITASGTAADPITFEPATPKSNPSLNVNVVTAVSTDQYGLYLDGASYVDVSGISFDGQTATEHSVGLGNASHDTVDEFTAAQNVTVTGTSGDDTISRGWLTDNQAKYTGSAIDVDSSGTGNVISTNDVALGSGVAGITVEGSADAAVISNTIADYCGAAVAIGDDTNGVASGASIENNVIEDAQTSASAEGTCAADLSSGISIGSAADESALTSNYNDVYPATNVDTAVYDWAGVQYQTPASLEADTSQGSADSIADPQVNALDGLVASNTSPVINSANSNAPGELSTDIDGNARAYDPNVPETGSGTQGYDRGSVQDAEDLYSLTAGTSPATAPSGAAVTITAPTLADNWDTPTATAPITYTYNFGDGSAPVTTTAASVTHTYASTGTYNYTLSMKSAWGASASSPGEIDILTPVTFNASLTTSHAYGLEIDYTAPTVTTDWPITTETLSFGDGTSRNLLVYSTQGYYHIYAQPGTYTVTLTVADAGGDLKTVTQSFKTAGSDYFPYGPTRLLNTATGLAGTESELTNNGSIKLKIAGNGTIPANVTAVDLNLTVSGANGTGYIQANQGSGSNGTSTVNYAANATYSNSVVAPVAADGTVTLENFGTSKTVTAQLTADVSGYFATSAGSTYTTLPNAVRVMNTVTGVGVTAGKLAAGKTDVLTIAGADGGALPSTGITAVALNVTSTNTSDAGNLTVYGDGATNPGTPNLSWQGAATTSTSVVAAVGSDGKIDIANGSTDGGSTDVLVDVSGYFTKGSSGTVYVPVTPTRALDTRTKAKPVGANSAYELDLDGVAGMPIWGGGRGEVVTGYVITATVTETEAGGLLAAGTGPTVPPATWNLDWSGAGQTAANLAFAVEYAPTSEDGVQFYNGGSTSKPTELLVDVMGYFATA